MNTAHWASSRSWSEHWEDALRSKVGIGEAALTSGEAYARHDTQLDVAIDKGSAHAVAGADRRIPHQVSIVFPVLDDTSWGVLVDRWAVHHETAAGLMSGAVPPALIIDAEQAGISLLPGLPEQGPPLTWSCSCSHELVGRAQPVARTAAARAAAARIETAKIETARIKASEAADSDSTEDDSVPSIKQPCKHTAAALLIIGQQIEDDPFELLALRGRTRTEVREALLERRADLAGPTQRPSVPAAEAWSQAPQPLPSPLRLPGHPGELSAFASEPPPSAPFTTRGLQELADDAARRAWHLLDAGAPAQLHLDAPTDLARRAAEAEGSPQFRELVERSGLTHQELSARATAWCLAGSAGVGVQLGHSRLVRVSPIAQLRQSADGSWFRYEKPNRRWLLVAGPADQAEVLLSPDPIAV